MKTYSPGLLTCPKLLILNSKTTKEYYRVIEFSINGEEDRGKKREKGEIGRIANSEIGKTMHYTAPMP